ncbi:MULTISPECIES: FMN-dependent dehydrogenase [unclassified Actinomyces]|uniref:FMN-dependent dehydrogenase n=1 Tax=unclassified Actinomyces TaxID=2609248 RepID=UPI002017D028|nr:MULTISPECIES: FMN-dependent dehydrogenase [unclassified Actinomyces]MCL3777996.1 FMN-dependent dehydrogenase [Actinomyces sp. AC-20-1]MCL3789617.1 FMN-dependent dehydrogenase [Actinomyces sp. 187325]MCL3791987.1 FMN-dependent dehydrogenase [Actinomyces sp. 186855]MCL3794689.1 FMN-dependent dehydrogenase [Actinomyces sp. 217892]
MPSYRSVLSIGDLAPGRSPHDVEHAVRGAVEATTVLEALQVDVVRGEPRVTARFTGTDDAEAREVHARTTAAVRAVAQVPRSRLAVVVSGRSAYLG